MTALLSHNHKKSVTWKFFPGTWLIFSYVYSALFIDILLYIIYSTLFIHICIYFLFFYFLFFISYLFIVHFLYIILFYVIGYEDHDLRNDHSQSAV